jgi:hypothetical protein
MAHLIFLTSTSASARVKRLRKNDEPMNHKSEAENDDMLPEYDFSGGVRGKYYERYQQGTNVVLLEPDLARVFHDSAKVNAALRQYLSEHGEPPTKPAV